MAETYGGAGPLLLGVTCTEAILGTTLIALRARYARIHDGRVRWDFIFVCIALPCALVAQIGMIIACLHGLGQHQELVGFDNLWEILKLTWIGLSVGITGATFGKLAIIALLLQITPHGQQRRRALLFTLAAFVTVVNFVQIPLILTQCTPFHHLWNRFTPGTCKLEVAAERYSLFQGAVASAADIFLAVYPVTVVWSLNMGRRVKIAFCVLMAGGFLPAAAALLRVKYSGRLLDTLDPSYDLYPYLLWACTELWFVLILGSIPPLRPLFERFLTHTVEAIHHSTGSESRSMKMGLKSERSDLSSRGSTRALTSHITVTRVTEVTTV